MPYPVLACLLALTLSCACTSSGMIISDAGGTLPATDTSASPTAPPTSPAAPPAPAPAPAPVPAPVPGTFPGPATMTNADQTRLAFLSLADNAIAAGPIAHASVPVSGSARLDGLFKGTLVSNALAGATPNLIYGDATVWVNFRRGTSNSHVTALRSTGLEVTAGHISISETSRRLSAWPDNTYGAALHGTFDATLTARTATGSVTVNAYGDTDTTLRGRGMAYSLSYLSSGDGAAARLNGVIAAARTN